MIRAIRARGDARAQVPIVALTAYAMREHRERIAAAGANGLISKPITSVEALGRGLAAHVAPRAAPARRAADAGGARRGRRGPVIDPAIYDALCEAIGAGDSWPSSSTRWSPTCSRAQRDLAGGARRRSTARRSARPRTS